MQNGVVVAGELTLRPFQFRDVDRMIEAFADPDIRHWHARRRDSIIEAREWVGYCHRLWLLELDVLDDGIHDVHLHAHVIGDDPDNAKWSAHHPRRERSSHQPCDT